MPTKLTTKFVTRHRKSGRLQHFEIVQYFDGEFKRKGYDWTSIERMVISNIANMLTSILLEWQPTYDGHFIPISETLTFSKFLTFEYSEIEEEDLPEVERY